MKSNTDYFDVRDLLKIVNGLIGFLLLLAYPLSHSSDYLNEFTIFLGCALALQTHMGLSKNRGAVDPFAIVLLYYVMVYYTFRIATLAFFDSSDVFRRFDYTPEDTNYALVFILISNACLLYGFRLGGKAAWQLTGEEFKPDILRVLKPLLWVLVFSVSASVFGVLEWVANYSRLLRGLVFFIRPTTWLIVVGAIYVVYHKEIPRSYFGVFALLYFVFALHLIIVGGSRGVIVFVIEMLAILLVCNEKFLIARKNLIKGLLVAPMLAVVLIVIYNFATLQRNVDGGGMAVRGEAAWHNLYAAVVDGDSLNDTRQSMGHIFSRVGFLDMASEIIAHKREYESIFNAAYYAKSTVDNVLTPGFDYYDVPKVSYALIFKHQNYNDGNPSKLYLKENNIYHSDQLSVYGEVYALFGWFSLIALFVVAYTLKWAYYNFLVVRDRYGEVLRRVLLLYFFVQIINSFGMDWIVVQMLPLVLTAFVVFVYYRNVYGQSSKDCLPKIT